MPRGMHKCGLNLKDALPATTQKIINSVEPNAANTSGLVVEAKPQRKAVAVFGFVSGYLAEHISYSFGALHVTI